MSITQGRRPVRRHLQTWALRVNFGGSNGGVLAAMARLLCHSGFRGAGAESCCGAVPCCTTSENTGHARGCAGWLPSQFTEEPSSRPGETLYQ
ncbi:hypothetical protein V5799_005121 [Amblyomma americanum]|uniref:Uncharacterized protein n=1 Tax=Amblyomma americanum TaxID=6943 RepID=A0AAQ4E059_AMBAM